MLQPSEGSSELAVTIVRCAALSVASVRSNPATERGVVRRQSSSNAFWCAVPMALGAVGASAGFCRTLHRDLGCAAPKDHVCLEEGAGTSLHQTSHIRIARIGAGTIERQLL